MINWFNMGEQKKESAPWHTGLIESAANGAITSAAIAVTGLAIVTVAVGGLPAMGTLLSGGTLVL